MDLFLKFMPKVIILTDKANSSRLKYVVGFIESCFDELVFEFAEKPSDNNINEVFVVYHNDLDHFPSPSIVWNQTEVLDLAPERWPLPSLQQVGDSQILRFGGGQFDLPAAVFWMLARVEEYTSIKKDQHGRFLWSNSLLSREWKPVKPLVDEWVDEWANAMALKFGFKLSRKPEQKSWSVGVDIDTAWKYSGKASWKIFAGFFRDFLILRMKKWVQRLFYLTGSSKDPYDVYSEIKQWNFEYNRLIYFVLAGKTNKYDGPVYSTLEKFDTLIKTLSEQHLVGVHPSYDYLESNELLKAQINKLASISRSKITSNRFHYLRLKLPDSYRFLEEAGIEQDYSMGFADQIGFRTGTCRIHKWYDLRQERVSELWIIPFCLMDRTLKDYLKLDPVKAVETATLAFEQVKKFKGHAHIIWHNSSFDWAEDWNGWEYVFREIMVKMQMILEESRS